MSIDSISALINSKEVILSEYDIIRGSELSWQSVFIAGILSSAFVIATNSLLPERSYANWVASLSISLSPNRRLRRLERRFDERDRTETDS